MRNLTGPKEFLLKEDEGIFEEIINKIENTFHSGGYFKMKNHIYVGIDNEYSTNVREKVVKAYENKGWAVVKHQTSSEKGESGDLTKFEFYF